MKQLRAAIEEVLTSTSLGYYGNEEDLAIDVAYRYLDAVRETAGTHASVHDYVVIEAIVDFLMTTGY